MPFRLLNKEHQDKLSVSDIMVPLVIFFSGAALTAFLATKFDEAEKNSASIQMVAAARESFKIQNLTLMNSLLKLQSYNSSSDLPLSSSPRTRSTLHQLLSSTDFTDIRVITLDQAHPTAEVHLRFEFQSTKILKNEPSPYLAKKLLLMNKNKVSHFLALDFDDGRSTINSVWQSTSRKNQYLVFSSPIEYFLKDWPADTGLFLKLADRHSDLELLISKKGPSEKNLIVTLHDKETSPLKELAPLYHNSFVSDYYGLESEWYQAVPLRASAYVYSVAGCGLLISLIVSLFARFILRQNRDIYRLVVARTEEMEAAMMQAKEANRAKTRFLANMSHELRTPLNLILGMLEVMQGHNPNEKERKYILSMQGAGRHLLNLITDLLTMAKDDVTDVAVQKTSFSAYNFFDDIASIARPECKAKGLEMALEFSPEIPPLIAGDTVKTRQILLNLIRNSLKYTSKGKISLKAELVKFAGEGKARSCHLRLTVRDTGIGIPEEKLSLIFDRLYQLETEGRNSGTIGLSLSIVRDLVLKLNGNITVKSQPGLGTEFIVDLDFDIPYKSEDLEKAMTVELDQISKEKSVLENGSSRTPINVLVVDDDAGNRELMLAYLDEPHFKVQLAENGAEAFEMYKNSRPDLIIADLRMPVMNGFQLAEAINDYDQKDNFEVAVPFVLLTADALEETQQEAKRYPISVFLTKPVRKRKVLEVINDLRTSKLMGQATSRVQQAV